MTRGQGADNQSKVPFPLLISFIHSSHSSIQKFHPLFNPVPSIHQFPSFLAYLLRPHHTTSTAPDSTPHHTSSTPRETTPHHTTPHHTNQLLSWPTTCLLPTPPHRATARNNSLTSTTGRIQWEEFKGKNAKTLNETFCETKAPPESVRWHTKQ